MKNTIATIAIVLITMSQLVGQSLSDAFFVEADQFFGTHVRDGRVDYSAAKSSSSLQSLVAQIGTVDLSQASDAEQKAFYINAYNLLVIYKVTTALPTKSVMDVDGFFDSADVEVGRETVSLNQLEKQLLFGKYPDSRLHFVLVCGAIGCPPIIDSAYRPAQLGAQLDGQTSAAINDESFITTKNGVVELSQIFNWYSKDFGDDNQSVISYINKYRKASLSDTAEVQYSEYDWSLNDQ